MPFAALEGVYTLLGPNANFNFNSSHLRFLYRPVLSSLTNCGVVRQCSGKRRFSCVLGGVGDAGRT